MTNFDTHGFLSDRARLEASGFENRHKVACKAYVRLGVLAHKITHTIKIKRNDLGHLYMGLLLCRMLSAYEGSYLLGIRGMKAEHESLLRSFIESALHLLAIEHTPGFATKLLDSADYERLRIINVELRNSYAGSTKEELETLASLAKSIKEKLKQDEVEKLTLAAVAGAAKQEWLYEVPYRLLCKSAHPDPNGLKRMLKLDTEGRIIEIFYGPQHEEVIPCFSLAMDTLLKCLACKRLGAPKKFWPRLADFHQKIERLNLRYLKPRIHKRGV